jgi:hypothetical protein
MHCHDSDTARLFLALRLVLAPFTTTHQIGHEISSGLKRWSLPHSFLRIGETQSMGVEPTQPCLARVDELAL